MKTRVVVFLLLTFFGQMLYAARLQSVKVKKQAGKTSLYFNLDQAVKHKAFTLTNPDRVVVDFEHTDLSFDLRKLNLNNKLIKLVRSGHPDPNTLRLVFEVADAVKLKARGHDSDAGHAFSVDLSASHNNPLPDKPNQASATHHTFKTPVLIHDKAKISTRDVVVVIDPGHGGKDPGAIGPRRTQEKQITLAIARKLKQIIDREPGMRAILTRNGDYYVGLRERLNIARKYDGDVFISIHADAFINQASSGASVFALSQRGATSEAARWLAEKENYSELGGVNLKDLDDDSGLVRTVLIDLSQTATISASLQMGDRVLRDLNAITELHNHRVEQARFMVLKSPDIPSILIETGFISNPDEERNLNHDRYQTRLTRAVFCGVKRYFKDYPPHGTYIEQLIVKNKVHVVKRGESLSRIAARYHISLSALKMVNRLSNNQIRPGQRLIIPYG